jgi:HlyD family secretion protein
VNASWLTGRKGPSPLPMKRLVVLALGAGVMAALVLGGRAALAQLETSGTEIPTAIVKRGQVDTSVHATGEIKTTKSELLSAPPAGAQLRILKLKMTGTPVKAGEVVVEFDPSEQEYLLEEQRSILKEAELEIEKMRAEAAAQTAQDQVDLLTARFDLRKAQLDVQGNELLSAIEARKRELTLEEAHRRLAQLDEDVKSRAKSSEASMAVALEKRNKARITMDQAQKLIDQMTLSATMDGIVAVRENRETNFFFWGMTFNDYREGDTVSSGAAVAEVLSLNQLEFSAKIPEADRSRISNGQQARVRLEALGGQSLEARVTHIGGINAGMPFFRGGNTGPTRQFDVTFSLVNVPAHLRPGLTARVDVAGQPLKDVLYVPRQAVFDKNGKTTLFVKNGGQFDQKDVKVIARTTNAVVIDKLTEGTEVALADPTRKATEQRAGGAGAPTRMVSAP